MHPAQAALSGILKNSGLSFVDHSVFENVQYDAQDIPDSVELKPRWATSFGNDMIKDCLSEMSALPKSGPVTTFSTHLLTQAGRCGITLYYTDPI